MLIEFSGKFVHELPEDKFTVVLKKVKGEESVPLFKTLTFRVNQIDHLGFHNAVENRENRFEAPTGDPCNHDAHDHSHGAHNHAAHESE